MERIYNGRPNDHRREKWLGAMEDKFGVPAVELVREGRARRPETSVASDFNQTDGGLDGTEAQDGGSGAGFYWADINGSMDVSGNAARGDSFYAMCRTATNGSGGSGALSSDDHYAEIDHVEDDMCCGVRAHPTQNTLYSNGDFTAMVCRYLKTVNGARTWGSNTNHSQSGPLTLRVEADGSTIKIYVNGVECISQTDTAIAGNTDAALYARRNNRKCDNFVAADLAAPASLALDTLVSPASLGALEAHRSSLSLTALASPSSLSALEVLPGSLSLPTLPSTVSLGSIELKSISLSLVPLGSPASLGELALVTRSLTLQSMLSPGLLGAIVVSGPVTEVPRAAIRMRPRPAVGLKLRPAIWLKE